MAKTAELPYRTLPPLPFKGSVSQKEIIRAVRAVLRERVEAYASKTSSQRPATKRVR